MTLVLSYAFVVAMSFTVMFLGNRLNRMPGATNPWGFAISVTFGTMAGVMMWRLTGTIVWAAVLASAALFSWSLGRWRRKILEIPKRPLCL